MKSKKYSSIAIGKTFTLGLTSDGEVFGWGEGFLSKAKSNEPVLINIDKRITKVAAGSRLEFFPSLYNIQNVYEFWSLI